MFRFLFLLFLACADAAAIECSGSDPNSKLDNVIEWREFDCDETGECGVIIQLPNKISDAKFEAVALIKGDSKNLDFLARLPTSNGDRYSTAVILGSEKFLRNFSVKALYNTGAACLSWALRPLFKE